MTERLVRVKSEAVDKMPERTRVTLDDPNYGLQVRTAALDAATVQAYTLAQVEAAVLKVNMAKKGCVNKGYLIHVLPSILSELTAANGAGKPDGGDPYCLPGGGCPQCNPKPAPDSFSPSAAMCGSEGVKPAAPEPIDNGLDYQSPPLNVSGTMTLIDPAKLARLERLAGLAVAIANVDKLSEIIPLMEQIRKIEQENESCKM